MPYRIKRVKGDRFMVIGDNGEIHAEAATLKKARAQIRLLRGIEHGMKLRNRQPYITPKTPRLR